MTETADDPKPARDRPHPLLGEGTRELLAVILLSITAVVTAWTGFQASKWGGAMSIAFSEASSSRITAARLEADANRRLTVQTGLFTQWLQAYQAEDDQLTAFLQTRFPEPLATAFPVWVASRPLIDPDAAATPFDLPEYAIPELAEAKAADARADRKFQQGLRNNQRGDDYTVLTIGFAAVLFFGALSGRMRSTTAQWTMLGVGGVGFLVLAAVLLSFPKLV
ncbi:hypothetical protein [Aeromicrobium massiliense]|uniref:hypothetical protein n=1 Tax=Aeromicrobium massiliense TaxID=1464554 RepID=UPI0006768526|nr:hypothetical protein [Aeromicrobium massiliense]